MPGTSEDVAIDELIDEGLAATTTGWDFDRFAGRMQNTPPGWDYRAMCTAAVQPGPVLDMGTGGGEQLAGWLATDPPIDGPVLATEGWPPNAPVASRRLGPLGVTVVQVAGATDNVDQGPDDRSGHLPFADGSIGTVVNRHESYRAAEVARVLRAGGTFLTQQVGGARGAADLRGDLREALGLPAVPPLSPGRRWTLQFAVDQAAAGGLTVVDAGVGVDTTVYHDIAPLVWYLRQAPWTVPELDLAHDRHRLRALGRRLDRDGPLHVSQAYFWLRATRRFGVTGG
jgi:hypothetical protein